MNEILEKLDTAREKLSQRDVACFTVDIDWASEYACQQTLRFFEEHGIPITVFLTHPSKVLDEALHAGKIRGGLHPNFMPDSSQGSTYKEVVDYCFRLLPDAQCFRAHRYYEVNDTMELLCSRGIRFESNVCSLLDNVPPFLHRSKTISFPIFWEDGAYLYSNDKFDFAFFKNRLHRPGLKVINIHPMHLMLNTPYFSYTREIKDRLTRAEWNNLNQETIQNLSYKGYGITNFIYEMISDMKACGTELMYLEDIYQWIVGLE